MSKARHIQYNRDVAAAGGFFSGKKISRGKTASPGTNEPRNRRERRIRDAQQRKGKGTQS